MAMHPVFSRFCGVFALLAAVFTVIMAPATLLADDRAGMPSVTVLADSQLAVPLSQLISLFAHRDMISVSAAFGASAGQKKKIEDGEPADLFITSDPALVQSLKLKGMVDVYSIGDIATQDHTRFTAAVVAGENMDPARVFLQYLKSPQAQEVFMRNGLSIP